MLYYVHIWYDIVHECPNIANPYFYHKLRIYMLNYVHFWYDIARLQIFREEWVPEVNWISVHSSIWTKEEILSKAPTEIVMIYARSIYFYLLTETSSIFGLTNLL